MCHTALVTSLVHTVFYFSLTREPYTSTGKEYNDKVTITNSLVIEQQSIGVANESQGYIQHLFSGYATADLDFYRLEGYDGILG